MGDEHTAQAQEVANTTETVAADTVKTMAEMAAEETTTAGTAAPEHRLPPAVAEYLERGWRMAPLRPGEKAPALARWPELRLDEAACARWFGWRAPSHGPDAGERNIGLILGAASGGLVDVDADAPEARRARPLLAAHGPCLGPAGRAVQPLLVSHQGRSAAHHALRVFPRWRRQQDSAGRAARHRQPDDGGALAASQR